MTRARDTADTQDNLGGAVAPFVAGKNKIINGDFGVWQRGTSGFGLGAAFNADRWQFYRDGSGATEAITQQTFTPGTAPVSGYEGQYFWRYAATVAGTGGTERSLYTKMEDVRTFAGQTATLSFWAKADASRTIIVSLQQNFGSGGSTAVTTSLTSQSVTTSWVRYSVTVNIPSIAGKTVGTSSYLQLTMGFPINVIETIDIWGVQLESGSVATPFTTASGSIGGELALCQRYYAKSYAQGTAPATNGTANGLVFGAATATLASTAYVVSVRTPVVMRTSPTITIYSFTTSQTGRVSDASGTDLAAGSGGTNLIADSGFTVQNSSGGVITAANGGFVLHYVASAEL